MTDIAELKAGYPKRDGGHGWGSVPRLLEKALAEGATWERIVIGTHNYARHCQRKGMVGTEYVMQARTFYGRDQHWEEWADLDVRSPAQIAADTRWTQLETRAKALGFNTVDRARGYAVAERAVEDAEKASRDASFAEHGFELPKLKAV